MSRQRISRFILCLLLLSAAACGQGTDDNPDGAVPSMAPADTDDRPLQGSVFIGPDVDTDSALRTSDPYQLEIDGDHAPVFENDTLILTISYSGGCESHDFTLVTNGSFIESDPVQLVFALTHDDNGDMCEAYPQERYSFDLEPIKMRYQEDYGTDEGSITLRLWHLGHPSGSVDAGFLELLYTFAP